MSKERFDYLVTKQSATRYCEHWVDGVDHESPIRKNHSDMVKFEPGDTDYEDVQRKLRGIAKRALVRKPRIDGTIKAKMPVPRSSSNADRCVRSERGGEDEKKAQG